jgi:undecaprenyl-diphosphatase
VARLIKYFFPHPRPSVLPDTHVLLFPDDNQAFPSGHATFFSALAAALYYYHKQIAFWYAVGALLIGLSRIIGGVHWPVDILAGYLLGGIIGAGVYYFYKIRF